MSSTSFLFVSIHEGGDVAGAIWSRIQESYLGWRYGRIDPKARLGQRGEQAAARLLRQKGMTIVAEGETDQGGEIDLIAVDRKCTVVVFVEVKTHGTFKPGHPADRVDPIKQGRITRAALRYLKRQQLLGVAARFDVVAVWWAEGGLTPERLEHYESAFEAVGEFQLYS